MLSVLEHQPIHALALRPIFRYSYRGGDQANLRCFRLTSNLSHTDAQYSNWLATLRHWLSLCCHLFWYPGRRFCFGIQADFLRTRRIFVQSLFLRRCWQALLIIIPSECKLFVCSWYSITLHPDHPKAEAISYRQVHSGLNRGSCNTSKFALLSWD